MTAAKRSASDVSSAAASYISEPLRPLAILIGDLTPDPKNARLHDEKNIEAIRVSLERYGQRTPIVAQKFDGGLRVRKGNGTLLAARELGWTHIACVVIEETDAESTAYAIADNRSGELADWDLPTLKELLEGLPDDLAETTGFSDGDLDALIESASSEEKKPAEKPDAPTVEVVPLPPGTLDHPISDVLANKQPATIAVGDCRELMRSMPAESIHTCISSPPYWGLRDYGISPSVWGGDAKCEHEWTPNSLRNPNAGGGPGINRDRDGDFRASYHGGQNDFSSSTLTGGKGPRDPDAGSSLDSETCSRCGAWRGCLGLEPNPEMFINHIVEVYRETKRVLRSDGTCWLNLGDCYTGSGKGRNADGVHGEKCGDIQKGNKGAASGILPRVQASLSSKNLSLIPHRVAMALQADGWILRSAIVWAKGVSFVPSYAGSVMPESVSDRPTSAYEMVFLLSKSERYFYDAEAVRENYADSRNGNAGDYHRSDDPANPYKHRVTGGTGYVPAAGRHLRNVWAISPQPFGGSHFATFAPRLITPMIQAATSEKGVCSKCGAPWERVTEQVNPDAVTSGRTQTQADDQAEEGRLSLQRPTGITQEQVGVYRTIGWKRTCKHAKAKVVPAIVFDPFSGACTTPMVALRLSRRAIGLEIKQDYAHLGRRRIQEDIGKRDDAGSSDPEEE